MNRFKLMMTVTLLGMFLVMGQAFAAGEGATDTKSSTGAQTSQPPMGSTETPSTDSMSAVESSSEFQRVSELMDANVKGTGGEDLGSIKDVIISSDGQARYIVLSKGGVLGVGGDLIPVPFDVAQPTKGAEGDYTLNIDQQTIDQAPTVAENELENSTQWEQEVRGYFGESQSGMGQSGMSGMPPSDTQTPSDTQAIPESSTESGTGTQSGTAPQPPASGSVQ